MKFFQVILLFVLMQFSADEKSGLMVRISGGNYSPMYGQTKDEQQIFIHDFLLDIYPVTNNDFLEFVNSNPQWRKSRVKRIYADKYYLINWKDDLEPGANAPRHSPVTYISWFAAKAYAKWNSKRLPTTDEWEFVGLASQTSKNGTKDSVFCSYLLNWYEKPAKYPLPEVGSTFKNVEGVYDMHGLIWEWTDDFNSIMLAGEGRNDKEVDKKLFCSGGAAGTKDLMNYAGFMRYAFRNSLRGSYCLQNLGFRCAKNSDLK